MRSAAVRPPEAVPPSENPVEALPCLPLHSTPHGVHAAQQHTCLFMQQGSSLQAARSTVVLTMQAVRQEISQAP